MSDTPRTDAVSWGGEDAIGILINFARELERERDTLAAQNEKLRAALEIALAYAEKADCHCSYANREMDIERCARCSVIRSVEEALETLSGRPSNEEAVERTPQFKGFGEDLLGADGVREMSRLAREL